LCSALREMLSVKAGQVVDDTMCGQNYQSRVMQVNVRHHDVVPGPWPRRRWGRGLLVAKGEGRLVAVVSIGEDQLVTSKCLADSVNNGGVRKLPDAIYHPVIVGDLRKGRLVPGQQAFDLLLRIVVQHKELLEMRARGSQ